MPRMSLTDSFTSKIIECFSIRSVGSIHATSTAIGRRARVVEQAFSIRSVGSLVCTMAGAVVGMSIEVSVSALSDRFMPRRKPDGVDAGTCETKVFSIRSVGSISVHAGPCCDVPIALYASSFSIRSVGSIHATLAVEWRTLTSRAVFQYPLCRIDSCPLAVNDSAFKRRSVFSIRSVGSIHATRQAGEIARRSNLSVSALSDRFMPRAEGPCAAGQITFSIRSVGSIHATRCRP